MKLTSAMLGITAAYAVEVTPTLESTAQIDTTVEEKMD